MKNHRTEIKGLRPLRGPAERPGPAGGKRETNRQRRVHALCSAGLELFLSHGLDGVTIEQITVAAGMAKGSFYRYFADKSELVATLLAPVYDDTRTILHDAEAALDGAESSTEQQAAWLQMAQRLAMSFSRHRGPLRLYLQEKRGAPTESRAQIRELAAAIDEAAHRITRAERRHGLLRSDYDLRVGVKAVVGAIEELAFAHLRGESLGDPLHLTRELISLLLTGVRAR